MPSRRRTLRSRIAAGLIGYTVLLTLAIGAHGWWVNEAAETVVWNSLLEAELDFFEAQRAGDPDVDWPQTETLHFWSRPRQGRDIAESVPPELATLAPGMHDEVAIGARSYAILVRDTGGERVFLALDITELEREEWGLILWIAGSALLAAAVLAFAVWCLSGRLLRPVQVLAAEVDSLRPDERGRRLDVAPDSSVEIATITTAMNQFLERHDRFVERERAFIDSASHELRTPVAVIAGAAELIAARGDLPAAVRAPLHRIQRTARGVEQLISMLLVLAKSPERLVASSETFDLADLVPDVVADHRHLTSDKALDLRIGELAASPLKAPLPIVQVAIGNLLRNAIENSDHGAIDIAIEPAGVVRISDPGTGMSPEDIGRLYAAMARRGDSRVGDGIGLALIGRICEHLGWRLAIDSSNGGGTTALLDLRASIAAGAGT